MSFRHLLRIDWDVIAGIIAAIGCVGVASHAGQIITGNRSTSVRTRSKEKLPAPITIEARNSTTSRPLALRIAPTS
jgi:hypothetical protein